MKRIIIVSISIVTLAVLVISLLLFSQITLLFNLDKVFLYQTRDNKLEIYKSNLFEGNKLDKNKLIKSIQTKPCIYIFGNKNDNYIDTRGLNSAYVFIFGLGGDDVLIGSHLGDYISGQKGNDLIVGCGGIDKLYGGDGNDYIYDLGGDQKVINDDFSFSSCTLSKVVESFFSVDFSQYDQLPWYYKKIQDLLGIPDEEVATRLLKKNQGHFSFRSNINNDPAIAAENKKLFEKLLKEAKAGEAFSQYNLSRFYLLGEGTKKNPKEAIKWLNKAADNDSFLAQRDLAFYYATGQVIKKDFQKSYLWATKALANPAGRNYDPLYFNELRRLGRSVLGKLSAQEIEGLPEVVDKSYKNSRLKFTKTEKHFELDIPDNWILWTTYTQDKNSLVIYGFIQVDKIFEAQDESFSVSRMFVPSVLSKERYSGLARAQSENFKCEEREILNEKTTTEYGNDNYYFDVLCKNASGNSYVKNKLIFSDKELYRSMKWFFLADSTSISDISDEDVNLWDSIFENMHISSGNWQCKSNLGATRVALADLCVY